MNLLDIMKSEWMDWAVGIICQVEVSTSLSRGWFQPKSVCFPVWMFPETPPFRSTPFGSVGPCHFIFKSCWLVSSWLLFYPLTFSLRLFSPLTYLPDDILTPEIFYPLNFFLWLIFPADLFPWWHISPWHFHPLIFSLRLIIPADSSPW